MKEELQKILVVGGLLVFLIWPLFAFKTWPKRILGLAVCVSVLFAVYVHWVIPKMTKAMYYYEPIPEIGVLIAQLKFYQFDHNRLPCVTRYADEVPIEVVPPGMDFSGGTSHLGAGFLTQTYRPVEDAANKGAVRYEPAMLNTATNLGVFPGWAELTTEQAKDHFAKHLGVGSYYLNMMRVRPNHIQYWCPAAQVGNTNVYAYAVGCFGDGNGLRAGTGYAVLEIWSDFLQGKLTATWLRFSPEVWFPTQICFVSPDENSAADPAAARRMNYCWVPRKSQITTKDPKVFDEMLEQLKQAGWDL